MDTVQNYLRYFMEALAVYKVSRYDIKGKRLLELHDKYYPGDIGIKHSLLGYREADISGILENMVFLELKRQGYEVSIGKLDNREIDFIAVKTDTKKYIQVCYLLASEETVKREFEPLYGYRIRGGLQGNTQERHQGFFIRKLVWGSRIKRTRRDTFQTRKSPRHPPEPGSSRSRSEL